MTQHYVGTKQIVAWEQEKDGQPGYAVKYADGSISWSPKDVFEATYLAIGHVGHLAPHQQRVVGEKAQLDSNLNKLLTALAGPLFGKVGPEELQRLRLQSEAMRTLSGILGSRIAAFEPVNAPNARSESEAAPSHQFEPGQSVWLKSGGVELKVSSSHIDKLGREHVHFTWSDARGVLQQATHDADLLTGEDPGNTLA